MDYPVQAVIKCITRMPWTMFLFVWTLEREGTLGLVHRLIFLKRQVEQTKDFGPRVSSSRITSF